MPAPKVKIIKPFPAPILVFTHIGAAILLGKALPLPLPSSILIQWFGFGCAMAGFLFGVLALVEFKKAHAASKIKASILVTTGVYRFTRNPVYLGFVLILIGLPLNFGNFWGIVLVWPLVTFMNNLVIKREEMRLENLFADEFTSYKMRVRRWL